MDSEKLEQIIEGLDSDIDAIRRAYTVEEQLEIFEVLINKFIEAQNKTGEDDEQ